MSYIERFDEFFENIGYTDMFSYPFLIEKESKKYEAIFSYTIKDNHILDLGKLALIDLNTGKATLSNLVEHLSDDDICNILVAKQTNYSYTIDCERYISLYEKAVSNLGILEDQERKTFEEFVQQIFLSTELAGIYKALIRNKE